MKIFNVYWDMGIENAVIPSRWPEEYNTKINASNPIAINFNNVIKMNTYLASSPLPMSPIGRERDIDAILKVIESAEKFVHISVTAYIPMMVYSPKPK